MTQELENNYSPIRKFATEFTHFLSGGVVTLLLGLVTFPILTRLLSSEQYGILGIVNTTMLLVVAISKAGLSDGIIRYHDEYQDTYERSVTFASTIILRSGILGATIAVIYVAGSPLLLEWLNIRDEYAACFLVMSAYVFVRPLNIVVLNCMRVTGNAKRMNLLGVATRIIQISLSLSLLVFSAKKLYAYFLGIIIAESLCSGYLYYWFRNRYDVRLGASSGGLAMTLVRFGAPLLLAELGYLLLTYADRYMIAIYIGEAAVGIYSVGYNLAMYISGIIMFAVSYAIIPVYVKMYKEKGRDETERFLEKAVQILIIVVLPIVAGYWAVADNVIEVLATDKYREAASFTPHILAGTILLGMNNVCNAGLYVKKRSGTIFGITLLAVIINIGLNLYLIPSYGIAGAAVATLIAAIVSTITTLIFSNRIITIRVNMGRIVRFGLLCVVMGWVTKMIHIEAPGLSLFIKIVVGLAIVGGSAMLLERGMIKDIYRLILRRN